MHSKTNWLFPAITLLFVLAACCCYNPLLLYFQNDDFLHIALSRQLVFFQHNRFRPVSDASVMIDYFIWGKHAAGYHLTSLLLHGTCTLMVYACSKKLLHKFDAGETTNAASLITALLFFLYPFHGEAVFWILGRSAMLGALFSLLFFYCYLSANTWLSNIMGVLFSMLALLSYESSWVLPLCCALLFCCDKKRSRRDALLLTALCILFAVYLLCRKITIHEIAGNYEAVNFIEGNIWILMKHYLQLVLRSWLPAFGENAALTITGSVLLFFTVVACLRLPVKLQRMQWTLGAVFLISLVPFLSFGIDTHGSEGERFLYLPSVVVCLLVGVVVSAGFETIKWRTVITLVFCSYYIAVLWLNAQHFRLAGNVVKMVINEMDQLEKVNRIEVQGLPQAQYGALVFRSGLKEGYQWLGRPGSVSADSIFICSMRSEIRPLHDPYKKQYVAALAPNANCNTVQAAGHQTARFVFTDSLLLIQR